MIINFGQERKGRRSFTQVGKTPKVQKLAPVLQKTSKNKQIVRTTSNDKFLKYSDADDWLVVCTRRPLTGSLRGI